MGVGRGRAEIESKTREGTVGVMTNAIIRTRTRMDGPTITTAGIDTIVATGNVVPVGRRSAIGGQGMREALNHATGHVQAH